MPPKVSILVLNYNGVGFLDDCLNSLKRLDYPDYEVILIDNASSDDSVEYAASNFPWVNVVKHEKNYGLCDGYNRSLGYAGGEYLAFLNNDTRVDRNWLTELVKAAQEQQADICGSTMLSFDNPERIASLGGRITPIGTGYDIGLNTRDDRRANEAPAVVGAVGSGAMLIEKSVFQALGGFDPDYFACVEDLDLCWRAWLRGYKVIRVPTAIVYHKVGGSWGSRGASQRILFGQKNRLANIIKNFEFSNVVKGLIISTVYDLARLVIFLSRGKFKNMLSLTKGTVYFIKELPRTMEKRKSIQDSRMLSDKELYRLGVIAPLKECVTEFIRLARMTA